MRAIAQAGVNGLSDVAKKVICRFLCLSPSLTAFGNTDPFAFWAYSSRKIWLGK